MPNAHGFKIPNPSDFTDQLADLLDDDDEGPIHVESSPAIPSQTVVAAPPAPHEEDVEQDASAKAMVPEQRAERIASPLPPSLQPRKRTSESRFELTERHRLVFEWLDFARYSTREQVAIFLDLPLHQTGKVLDKLILHGYVGRKKYAGYPTAYYLTPWAKSELESETAAVNPESGPGFVRHTLDVAWTVLGLIKRRSALTPLVESMLERPSVLSDFVSESQLGVSLRAEREAIEQNLRDKQAGRSNFVSKPTDAEIKERLHWNLTAKARQGIDRPDRTFNLANALAIGEKNKPHKPDLLLVSHEGGRAPYDSRPHVVLAFEIERSYKPVSLHSMMEAYIPSENPHLDGCVWVTGGEPTHRRVASYFPPREQFLEAVQERSQRGQARVVPQAVLAAKQALRTAVDTSGDEFHQVIRSTDDHAWKDSFLAELAVRAEKRAAKDREARAMNAWHVKASLAPEPCLCGLVCRAKHGRFRTEAEARTKAARLTATP